MTLTVFLAGLITDNYFRTILAMPLTNLLIFVYIWFRIVKRKIDYKALWRIAIALQQSRYDFLVNIGNDYYGSDLY